MTKYERKAYEALRNHCAKSSTTVAMEAAPEVAKALEELVVEALNEAAELCDAFGEDGYLGWRLRRLAKDFGK